LGAESAICAEADAHLLTVGIAALRPVRAKGRAVTRRTSQQDLAAVLIILNQIARERATASGTPWLRHTFTRIGLAWWRVRMLYTRCR
jgi:RNA-directed DNA polymerase